MVGRPRNRGKRPHGNEKNRRLREKPVKSLPRNRSAQQKLTTRLRKVNQTQHDLGSFDMGRTERGAKSTK